MHIHILGICGTFMGSLAVLAKELGHRVTGSDANVYPPMSTQLEAQGIELMQGYEPAHLEPAPDLVVVGNAMSRGNPAVEYVLNKGLPYVSGPQWLADHVLQGRWVLGVAGTHGKTTTTSMLAWVLEHAGMSPGFLIGGVPQNFGISARLGGTPFFVVEADEYDSAFFDKRSKFVHYRPRTAILNNLEFDHADIFPDLAAIERQFHHLVRIIPSEGLVIHPASETALARVIEMGCWTPVQTTGEGGQWQARLLSADGSRFEVSFDGKVEGTVEWNLTGQHNVANALAAIGAVQALGVPTAEAVVALKTFAGIRRRMEVVGTAGGVTVIDDFAHNPDKIAATLKTLHAFDGRLLILFQPHGFGPLKLMKDEFIDGFAGLLRPDDILLMPEPVYYGGTTDRSVGSEDIAAGVRAAGRQAQALATRADCGDRIIEIAQPGDRIVVMGARDDSLSTFAAELLARL